MFAVMELAEDESEQGEPYFAVVLRRAKFNLSRSSPKFCSFPSRRFQFVDRVW